MRLWLKWFRGEPMEEVWKDIQGYEGLYQVSNLGQVRSLDRWVDRTNQPGYFLQGKILKSRTGKNGYKYVVLCSRCEHRTFTIHRLVALAFVSNPNGLMLLTTLTETRQTMSLTISSGVHTVKTPFMPLRKDCLSLKRAPKRCEASCARKRIIRLEQKACISTKNFANGKPT